MSAEERMSWLSELNEEHPNAKALFVTKEEVDGAISLKVFH
jgi:hypothetical protein